MPSTNVRFRRSRRTRQSSGHRKKKTAFAISSVTFLAAMLSTTIAPSADARTVKKKTATSKAPKTVPEDPKDRAQRLQFVEVVRLAALPHAIRVHATLGTPTCIGGVDLKPGRTFQCVVAFDASPIPFSVTVGGGNALVAAPTFPVVDTRTIATSVSASTCGSAPFAAVPTGSVLHCSISHGKKKAATTVSVRITGPDGTFTRIN